jgi:hypothetical protein
MEPELSPLMKKRIYNREWKKKNGIKKAATHSMDTDGNVVPINSGVNVDKVVAKAKKDSIVNRVTEYGALFNKLNDEHVKRGRKPLKTAMEILIEAMQSEDIPLKEKARIAEKLATFESSRAPIISIEHVQNIARGQEDTAEEALDDFLLSIRKA